MVWASGMYTSVDDSVFTCRNMEVAEVKCRDRGRKTWEECVKNEMELLGLQPE